MYNKYVDHTNKLLYFLFVSLLFQATKHGSHEVVKMLLESDPNCALIRNVMGNTPLHTAADVGNLAAAIAICSKSPNSAKIQVSLSL